MTETRALLLTDVVDSTRLAEALGDAAMAGLWAAHDRTARDLLPRWRGREIDKTDGMLLMFDAAVDAVGYAMAYHRGLAALSVPLQARAGLHVGPVLLRENSADDVARGAKPIEVDGLAKPVAARVMSLAQGGQTLLTPEALAALGETALRVQSHGHWVMKGVSEPVELFEAGDAHAPFAAPADSEKVYRVVRSGERWLPVREIPNNLPQPATSFVGRERELAELKARLGTARLITLLGMGGLGKTRLSIQVALESMPHFPDGAWFVDLSAIRDPALVAAEAARAFDVAEEPGRPLIETLCAHLRPRRALLILDNCEHLIDPAGDMVHALLQAAPQLRVMASSREPLDVPGEQSYPIHPLPLPERGGDLGALMRSTAARLFVDRVLAHRPDFEVGAADAAEVADLVVRLEGIPLAIELAAARMRTLGLAEINAGLRQRFDVLTGGSRRLQARQQTLRALVDWSYDLLRDDEKRVFDRLAVFAGGFDEPAALAVCSAAPIDAASAPALLASLVEKSLVLREELAGGARWRLLETIRDYAADKLGARSDDAAATAARHGLHYFALAKEGARGLPGAEQPLWLRRFEAEMDNLRAARATAVAGGVDPVIAVKLAVAMMGFWEMRGHVREGRAAVREALALPAVQASEVAAAWGLYVDAVLAESQGEHDQARRQLERCLALRRGLGDRVQIAATLSTLALARLRCGDAAGAAANEGEALEIFRAEGDAVGELIGRLHLGQIALHDGDDARAQAELERARAQAAALGNHEVLGESERLLGEIALWGGQPQEAATRYERALAVCREAGDRNGEAHALRGLGLAALRRGDVVQAGRLLHDALRTFDSFDLREHVVATLGDHVELLVAAQRADTAAALAAACEQARVRLALVASPREARRWAAVLAALRDAAGGQRFDDAWHRGRRWELGDAVREALASLPA